MAPWLPDKPFRIWKIKQHPRTEKAFGNSVTVLTVIRRDHTAPSVPSAHLQFLLSSLPTCLLCHFCHVAASLRRSCCTYCHHTHPHQHLVGSPLEAQKRTLSRRSSGSGWRLLCLSKLTTTTHRLVPLSSGDTKRPSSKTTKAGSGEPGSTNAARPSR